MARVGIAVLEAFASRKGGVDVYASSLARALTSGRSRHEYTILSASDSVPEGLHAENVGEQSAISRFDTVLWHLGQGGACETLHEFKMTRAIDRVCRKLGLDCLHFPATRITVPMVCARSMLTFFDMQYAFLPQFFSPSDAALIDRAYRASVNKAECVIAPTRFTFDSLREKYGVPEDKMVEIPAGISDDMVPAGPDDIVEVRRKYGLGEASYILYPANPWPHKNHARLLKALRSLLDSKVNVPRLVLTGRLPGKDAVLGDLVRQLKLEGVVSDLGFVSRRVVEILMSGASMMIFPSLFEGFGFPVLEAMASGCPVASSNAACLPEIVGDAGLLFDPLSEVSIADAIMKMAVRGENLADYRQKGHVRVDLFRWSRVVPQLEKIYERFEGRS